MKYPFCGTPGCQVTIALVQFQDVSDLFILLLVYEQLPGIMFPPKGIGFDFTGMEEFVILDSSNEPALFDDLKAEILSRLDLRGQDTLEGR